MTRVRSANPRRLVLAAMLVASALGAALVLTAKPLSAQSTPPPPMYVQLPGVPGSVTAALYAPAEENDNGVGIVVCHRNSNFLSHITARNLPARGYTVLACNPRSYNNEFLVDFERNALDMAAAVKYLRDRPNIRKVGLIAHSGGGPASTFYQAVAENGVAFCQDPRKLVKCPDDLEGMPPADAVALMDSHPGVGVNALRSLNAAVTDEEKPWMIDPRLDPFRPANGFNPDGVSTYSEDFKRRYFRAQSGRMNRLIATAQRRLREVERGAGVNIDDEPFICYKCDAARLYDLDTSIHGSTERPAKWVHNDGSITTEIARSVRPPMGPGDAEENRTLHGGTMVLSLRSFLSARAIRSTDSMDGIDHCSSNTGVECNLQNISVPTLVLAMGCHYFVRDGERLYEASNASIKDFAVIDGATHGGTPCRPEYSNATRNLMDYFDRFFQEQFGRP